MKQALNFPDDGGATPGSLRHNAISSATPDDSEKCTDDETQWFNHHHAIRLFQADYEYVHADWAWCAMAGAPTSTRRASAQAS